MLLCFGASIPLSGGGVLETFFPPQRGFGQVASPTITIMPHREQ